MTSVSDKFQILSTDRVKSRVKIKTFSSRLALVQNRKQWAITNTIILVISQVKDISKTINNIL